MIHGMPVLHDESMAEVVLASYKAVSRPFSASQASQHLSFCSMQHVVATIKWHAFAGSNELQVSAKTRIRTLKRCLKRDLFHLWDLPEDHPARLPHKYTFVPHLGAETEFSRMKL